MVLFNVNGVVFRHFSPREGWGDFCTYQGDTVKFLKSIYAKSILRKSEELT